MKRNILMYADGKSIRAMVDIEEFERKYSSFKEFSDEYAKRNRYNDCVVTGFGKVYSDEDAAKRNFKIYALAKNS